METYASHQVYEQEEGEAHLNLEPGVIYSYLAPYEDQRRDEDERRSSGSLKNGIRGLKNGIRGLSG